MLKRKKAGRLQVLIGGKPSKILSTDEGSFNTRASTPEIDRGQCHLKFILTDLRIAETLTSHRCQSISKAPTDNLPNGANPPETDLKVTQRLKKEVRISSGRPPFTPNTLRRLSARPGQLPLLLHCYLAILAPCCSH